MELVRQPIFLLLATATAAFELFLASINYFGFGDEPKLVKNSVLAVMLLSGLFGAVISASSAVAREIRTGTALAVLAKPVGKAQFILAKYLGLAGALAVLIYITGVAALLASRMAFDAYGDPDKFSLALFAGAVVLAYGTGGFVNYFLRRNFTAYAVLALVVLVTIVLIIVASAGPRVSRAGDVWNIDWRMVPACLLILCSLWILAALAVACSTRLEMIPTLAICSGLFLLGLMSDYLFGRPAAEGAKWASVLYALTPNWQLFWVGDLLEGSKQFPWGYFGKALLYVTGYVGAALAVALCLFEDRELN